MKFQFSALPYKPSFLFIDLEAKHLESSKYIFILHTVTYCPIFYILALKTGKKMRKYGYMLK